MSNNELALRMDNLIKIGRIHAIALSLFGPADSWDHPLNGTKYDPRLKQLQEQQRRYARQARKAARHQPLVRY